MDTDSWAYPDEEAARVRLSGDGITIVGEDGTAFSIPLENVRSVRVEYEATPKDAKKAVSKNGPADRLAHGETTFTVFYRSADKMTRRDKHALVLLGAHPALVEFAAEATRRAHVQKD